MVGCADAVVSVAGARLLIPKRIVRLGLADAEGW
jgi:hypothetical protein